MNTLDELKLKAKAATDKMKAAVDNAKSDIENSLADSHAKARRRNRSH